MLLLLGTKRTHAQTSSDVEDEPIVSSYSTAESSPPIKTPVASSTPDDFERKRKKSRYSIPSESPSNVFRVGNDLLYRRSGAGGGAGCLPDGVTSFVEIRLQIDDKLRSYRALQVPSNYSLTHLFQLVQFLFGWNAENASDHSWRLVKDLVQIKGRISQSRPWVTINAEGQCEGGPSKGESVETNENKWTVARIWGAGGVFSERGAILDGFEHAIHVTVTGAVKLSEPSNEHIYVNGASFIEVRTEPRARARTRGRGRGCTNARSSEAVAEVQMIEVDESSFHGDTFKDWLDGKVETVIDTEIAYTRLIEPIKQVKGKKTRVMYRHGDDLDGEGEVVDEL